MKKTVAFFLCAILSLVLGGAADAAAVFGPRKYLRVEGGTTVFNDTLTATAGPARIFIQNGEVVGENRVDNVVSSARVMFNGVEVFSPNDFIKQVYTLEALVNLTAGENALTAEINGKPGTFLTLRLTRPEVSLQANPERIQAGATSVLSWSALDAVSCRIEPGIGAVATSGSRSVSPTVYRPPTR